MGADALIAAMSTTFCVDGEMLSRNVVQSLSWSWSFVISLLCSSVS